VEAKCLARRAVATTIEWWKPFWVVPSANVPIVTHQVLQQLDGRRDSSGLFRTIALKGQWICRSLGCGRVAEGEELYCRHVAGHRKTAPHEATKLLLDGAWLQALLRCTHYCLVRLPLRPILDKKQHAFCDTVELSNAVVLTSLYCNRRLAFYVVLSFRLLLKRALSCVGVFVKVCFTLVVRPCFGLMQPFGTISSYS